MTQFELEKAKKADVAGADADRAERIARKQAAEVQIVKTMLEKKKVAEDLASEGMSFSDVLKEAYDGEEGDEALSCL